MSYAPIIVFVYNRPYHTKKVLELLGKNFLAAESDVFIFSDGPKDTASQEELHNINEVRKVIREYYGFKSVSVNESDRNNGLALSIINGVTNIVNKYEKCIVLEDDLKTSPYFLTYMNDALKIYEETENVACIHGYVEPHKKRLPETFFIKGADCWGWATWKRAWDVFNPNGQELLDELHKRHCEKHFNFNNMYNYIGMLEDQIAGKNNSWAIRWLASAYLNDMYCLYPNETLVENIGFDGTGTHCQKKDNADRKLAEHRIDIVWQEPKECIDAWNEYVNYFKEQKSTLLKRAIRKMKRLFLDGNRK